MCTLKIRVQPGARREKIIGFVDGCLRVAVQAPPVEGAANQAVIRLLARLVGTSKSKIRLVRGEKSKNKTLEFVDLTPSELRKRLGKIIDTSNMTEESLR